MVERAIKNVGQKEQPLVLFVCRELGQVTRGFEQYNEALALLLMNNGSFRVLLAAGGSPNQSNVPAVKIRYPRLHWLKSRLMPETFRWEQRFFVLGLLPLLIKRKPALVYVGEFGLYALLWHVRNKLGFSFSLTLYTGGQAIPGPTLFNPVRDYVHHVTPAYLPVCNHIPSGRQTVLPHFICDDFKVEMAMVEKIKKQAGTRKIVLSIGLLDTKVKQMDKLVAVLAQQPEKWFPVLLGQPCADTPFLVNSLDNSFGREGYILDHVPHSALGTWFEAADVFVSCSPRESFGLAMVEALFYGLPVVVHDFFEARWVLGDFAVRVNVNDPDGLAKGIALALENNTEEERELRKAYARSRYGTSQLQDAYISLFSAMLKGLPLQQNENYQQLPYS